MYRSGCIPSRATSFLIIFSDPVPIAASGRDIVFNHSTGPRRPTRPQTAIRFHRANSGNKNVVAAEMQRVSDRYLMAANGSPRACASGKGCNDGPVGNGPRLRDIKRSRASISSPRVSAIDRKKPRFNLAPQRDIPFRKFFLHFPPNSSARRRRAFLDAWALSCPPSYPLPMDGPLTR